MEIIQYNPTIQTMVFVVVFFAIYLFILIRNAIKNQIDLYDLLLLSMVAFVPFIFVFFPGIVSDIARLIGVGFGLIVLFGILFVIVFAYLYRLILKIKAMQHSEVLMLQELSLLKYELLRSSTSKPCSGNEPAPKKAQADR